VGIGETKRVVKQYARKLTPDQVLALRARYAQGRVGYVELAREYHVTMHTIRLAVTGQTWKHLPGAIPSGPQGAHLHQRRGEHHPNAKLTAAQVEEIRVAIGRQSDISARYGVCQPHVSAIKTGRAWRE
jgi:hypothetical protein